MKIRSRAIVVLSYGMADLINAFYDKTPMEAVNRFIRKMEQTLATFRSFDVEMTRKVTVCLPFLPYPKPSENEKLDDPMIKLLRKKKFFQNPQRLQNFMEEQLERIADRLEIIDYESVNLSIIRMDQVSCT